MFETVFSLQTNENSARFFFYGLALIGGVLGAFLPPLSRLSRLPYTAFVIIIYAATFGITYVIGQSVSIPLVFWGYILVGLISGVATALIARARSVDIIGNGSYAFMGFIPILALYLFFARGRFEGISITKSQPVRTQIGLGVAAVFGGLLALGASNTHGSDGDSLFAKEVAANVIPARLDDVTLLLRAEATGNLVRIFYTFEGPAEVITPSALEKIRVGVCSDVATVRLFSQAGVEREFVYLNKNGELIGSFFSGC